MSLFVRPSDSQEHTKEHSKGVDGNEGPLREREGRGVLSTNFLLKKLEGRLRAFLRNLECGPLAAAKIQCELGLAHKF